MNSAAKCGSGCGLAAKAGGVGSGWQQMGALEHLPAVGSCQGWLPIGPASSPGCNTLPPLLTCLCVLQEHYPQLMKDVKIRVVELMDYVLSTYDRKIGEYTAQRFARAGG